MPRKSEAFHSGKKHLDVLNLMLNLQEGTDYFKFAVAISQNSVAFYPNAAALKITRFVKGVLLPFLVTSLDYVFNVRDFHTPIAVHLYQKGHNNNHFI